MKIKERCEDCEHFVMADFDNYVVCRKARKMGRVSDDLHRPVSCSNFQKKFPIPLPTLKKLAKRYGFKVACSEKERERLEKQGYQRVEFDIYNLLGVKNDSNT